MKIINGVRPDPHPTVAASVAAIVADLGQLISQQIELMRMELKDAVAARGKGVALMAAAAILALYVLGFVGAAGAAALALVMPIWAALTVVALLFAIVAGVAFIIGRRTIAAPDAGIEMSTEMLKEDIAWAKQQMHK